MRPRPDTPTDDPGSEPAPHEAGGLRLADGWPFLLLASGLLVLGFSFWRPVPAGVWHDDGVYLVIGKAVAAGDGLTYSGVPGELPAVKFPPAYPSVLGALWAALGSLRAVTLAAVLLNLFLLAWTGSALAGALDRAGIPRRAALAVGGMALVSADVWRTALVPLSEPMFMALTASALACWGGGRLQEDRRRAGLLAAVLALTVLTRSAGWAVVAGFGVAALATGGMRLAAAITAPAAMAGLGWAGWSSVNAARIPDGLADVLGPYGGWLRDQLFGAPLSFLAALPGHAIAVFQRVFSLLLPGLYGPWLWAAAVPVALVVVVGLATTARRLAPLPWVVGAYLGMLLLWPFVDRRLVAPLHPLLVVAAGVGFLELGRLTSRSRLRDALVVGAFAWVATITTVTAGRAARGWAVAGYQLRAGRLAAAVETLESTAPADAVVGAPEFWAGIHLHGGWTTVPSARFVPRSEDERSPVWGTPREQLDLWWGAGVEFVLLEQGGQIHGEALTLLEESCPGVVSIVARMPPQMLVRLSWDRGCAEVLGLASPG